MSTSKKKSITRGEGRCGGVRRKDGSGGGKGNIGTKKQPKKK